jgi:hypothetical protein
MHFLLIYLLHLFPDVIHIWAQHLKILAPCSFICLPLHQCAVSSTWYFNTLELCQFFSLMWHLIKLLFHHIFTLPFCQLSLRHFINLHLVNLPFCQPTMLSTWTLFHQLAVCQHSILSTCFSSACFFVNLLLADMPFYQLAFSSTSHIVTLMFHRLALLSSYKFINLPLSKIQNFRI